jgi:putative sigma-54 modulation protein
MNKQPVNKAMNNIRIQSPHFTPDQRLTDFVTGHVGKLSHFDNQIMESDVCLKLDKSDTTDNKVCEIRLKVPGNDFFAERSCHTFEEAVRQTVHALREQISKHKVKG